MKTPMQELIELITLKENKEDGCVFLMPYITIAKLEAMLDKEQGVIENAYWDGGQWVPTVGSQCGDYYNETFNNK